MNLCENITRIQYLLVGGKLYQVTYIDFSKLTIEARECDLDVGDVSEDEVFLLEDFEEFKVTLRNRGGKGKVVDFVEWVEGHGDSRKYQLYNEVGLNRNRK